MNVTDRRTILRGITALRVASRDKIIAGRISAEFNVLSEYWPEPGSSEIAARIRRRNMGKK